MTGYIHDKQNASKRNSEMCAFKCMDVFITKRRIYLQQLDRCIPNIWSEHPLRCGCVKSCQLVQKMCKKLVVTMREQGLFSHEKTTLSKLFRVCRTTVMLPWCLATGFQQKCSQCNISVSNNSRNVMQILFRLCVHLSVFG